MMDVTGGTDVSEFPEPPFEFEVIHRGVFGTEGTRYGFADGVDFHRVFLYFDLVYANFLHVPKLRSEEVKGYGSPTKHRFRR